MCITVAKRKTCLLHLCGTAVLFVNDKFSVMFTLCYLMLFFLTCWHQGSLDNPNLDNASKYLPEQVLRNISIWRGKWQGLLLRDLWQWKIFTALMILIPQPVAADGFYTAAAATALVAEVMRPALCRAHHLCLFGQQHQFVADLTTK